MKVTYVRFVLYSYCHNAHDSSRAVTTITSSLTCLQTDYGVISVRMKYSWRMEYAIVDPVVVL